MTNEETVEETVGEALDQIVIDAGTEDLPKKPLPEPDTRGEERHYYLSSVNDWHEPEQRQHHDCRTML